MNEQIAWIYLTALYYDGYDYGVEWNRFIFK